MSGWRDEHTHTSCLSKDRAILTDCGSYIFGLGMFRRANLCGHDRSLWSTLKSEKINRSATQESPEHESDPEGTPEGRKKTKTKKSSWHDSPFSRSLRSWLFSHSSSMPIAPQCGAQCIGGRMPARTKWADKRPAITSLAGDSLLWPRRNFPARPARVETRSLLMCLHWPQPFLLAKRGRANIGTTTKPNLKISQDNLASAKTGTSPHPHEPPDLWLTQMLKLAIMQLAASLWRTAVVSTVTGSGVEVIGARHKERETAKEGRWGVMSSCLKWL